MVLQECFFLKIALIYAWKNVFNLKSFMYCLIVIQGIWTSDGDELK